MGVSLTRTAGTPTSKKKFTFSVWYKKTTVRDYGASTSDGFFFNSASSNDNRLGLYINQENSPYDQVRLVGRNSASQILDLRTNAILRDPSAWYHIVAKVDTTQSTNTDRAKLYINGIEQTLDTSSYPNQDVDLEIQHTPYLLSYSGSGNYLEGLITHYHYTDGYAYDASTFGSTDSTTGEWTINVSPSVTYGTNGFFMFKDNASVTDQSGNSNNFTLSGTLTPTQDNPSNNFCTWNSVKKLTVTLSNGNTTTSGNGDNGVWGTIGDNQGKWYWETQENVNNCMVGIASEDVAQSTGRSDQTGVYGVQNGTTYAYYRNNGSSGQSSGFPQVTTSNTVCHALDLDNGKYYVGIDGVFKSLSGTTSDISAGSNATFTGLDTTKFWFPFTESRGNSAGCDANFGNGYFGTTAISSAGTNASNFGSFEYDVPAGFTAWCTKGLNE